MTTRILWFIFPISSSFYLRASALSKLIREHIDVQINAGYLLSELLAVLYLPIIYLPICVKESVITNSDGPWSRVNCHLCTYIQRQFILTGAMPFTGYQAVDWLLSANQYPDRAFVRVSV
jgi:hypothetical protein